MTGTSTLAGRLAAWRTALPSEAFFWDLWISTSGHLWPDDFTARMDASRPLPYHIAKHLPDSMNARVLDVGAGPATVLGRTHPKRNIDLVACDPLAPVYNTLLDRHGVTPPIRTVQAFAEDLSSVFDAESFDIVYCQNALDHSFEPLRGIEEMLIVLRTRGVIVMAHYTDEAEHERYVGLHQWNFNARDGRFIIWNRVQEIDVNEALKDVARVTVTVEGRGHAVTIEKLRDWPNSLHERHRNRLASLLSGLLDAEGVTKAADQELKRINAMANPADGEHRDEALKPAQHSP